PRACAGAGRATLPARRSGGAPSGNPGARRATIEVVTTMLPLAPAGVGELDVVLVLALDRARVDRGPVEGVVALDAPALDGGGTGSDVRRHECGPKVLQRRARIARVRRENAERMHAGHAMQEREVAGCGVGLQHRARDRVERELVRIEARGVAREIGL